MAAVDQVASRSFLKRGGAILISIGILSSMAVYLAHGWFHGTLLPSLGIGSAFGDAVGGFIIILFAYVAQRLASLAIFDDTHFGLLCSAQQLQMANAGLKVELSEVDKLASTDRLTGCWNRHRFDEVIVSEIDRLTRYGQSLSMLIVDIDHFKSVNDNHGHSVGDSVLVELVSLVRSGLRLSDSLTRWGGEEFVVLCPNTSLTTAVVLAERLREKVSQTPFGKVGALTVSIGVAECLVGEQWQQWLDRADAELYGAKRNGRNQVRFAPETPLRVASDDFLDHNLVQLSWRKAFESGHGGIDRDHQALFSIANDLLNAIVSGKPF
jgi:diguanylate cyclase (GGDEF)-like protein